MTRINVTHFTSLFLQFPRIYKNNPVASVQSYSISMAHPLSTPTPTQGLLDCPRAVPITQTNTAAAVILLIVSVFSSQFKMTKDL